MNVLDRLLNWRPHLLVTLTRLSYSHDCDLPSSSVSKVRSDVACQRFLVLLSKFWLKTLASANNDYQSHCEVDLSDIHFPLPPAHPRRTVSEPSSLTRVHNVTTYLILRRHSCRNKRPRRWQALAHLKAGLHGRFHPRFLP